MSLLFIHMRKFKITNEQLTSVVKESFSFREVLRRCNISLNSGSTYNHYRKRIKKLGLDISHFRGNRNNFGINHVGGCQKIHWSKVLIKQSNNDREKSLKLRRAYTEYCQEHNINIECVGCKNKGFWLDKVLKLEISHKNDNRSNNTPNNLEWICPNCHSIK